MKQPEVLSPEAASHLRELLEADQTLEGEAAEYEAEMTEQLRQMVEGALSDPGYLRVYLCRVYDALLQIHRAGDGSETADRAWAEISAKTAELLKTNVLPVIHARLERDARKAELWEQAYEDWKSQQEPLSFH